ncbi:MAG: LuxR family transcriptional regulator [Planctomycetota bacterium]|nr:MAG: LuxR family transcriptional regulator [Planctomycetota bacterium]
MKEAVMGESGQAIASAMESVVRASERLCGLPAVATLDWSDRAARALSVLLAPSRVCVMILRAEPSGRISVLEASGSGSCLSRAAAEQPAAAAWTDQSGDEQDAGSVELSVRSRADRLRELGFRLDGLGPSGSIAASASRLAGTELWRTAPIGSIWVGTDISDLLIGVASLDSASPRRYLVVQIGVVGHGATGPRRVTLENQAALQAILPLLTHRARLALGTSQDSTQTWLTVREQQVLEQLVLGKSVRQIAEDLGRSPHTVHDHVKSLHRKLGASSRGELIARALGYIEEGTRIRDRSEDKMIREPKLTITHTEPEPPEIVVRTERAPTEPDR